MFEMFLVPEVRTGPMDPREHNLGVMFFRVTGHPFAELHVVADDEKARIYFFVPRVGAFVCVAHAYAGGAPFAIPVLSARVLS